jgi:hypothetical protein
MKVLVHLNAVNLDIWPTDSIADAFAEYVNSEDFDLMAECRIEVVDERE